jgi:hypothetical protein
MKKHLILLFTGCALALTGCSTSHHAAKWEYKTVIVQGKDTVPLDASKGTWTSDDKVINDMAKEGWTVTGYGVDQANGQWFLLKRRMH